MNPLTRNKPSRRSIWRPRILDRYVASEFMVSYLNAICVVLLLRVILDLFIMFDEFVERGAGEIAPGAMVIFAKILRYYGPQLLWYFRDFSGTIIVLASVFALARMARNNEFTAVLASGISLKRLIAPIVLLAFVFNLFTIIDQEFILPNLADKLVRRHDEMDKLRPAFFYLMPDRDGALLSAQQFDPATQTITGMNVILREKGRVIAQINAPKAHWDNKQKQWTLTNGKRLDNRTAQAYRTAGVTTIECYPSDLSAEYLWLQRHSNFKTLMSSADLSALAKRQLLRPGERSEIYSEKLFRFTDPIINMIMLLLALPLLVSRQRRNTKTAIFLAILGTGSCFIATFACKLLAGQQLIGAATLHPLLAAALPIIVFLPLSVLALDGLKT